MAEFFDNSTEGPLIKVGYKDKKYSINISGTYNQIYEQFAGEDKENVIYYLNQFVTSSPQWGRIIADHKKKILKP